MKISKLNVDALKNVILNTFIGRTYEGEEETRITLKSLTRCDKCRNYDNRIYDGVLGNSDDTYIMESSFECEFEDGEINISIYYGDVSEKITDIDIDIRID